MANSSTQATDDVRGLFINLRVIPLASSLSVAARDFIRCEICETEESILEIICSTLKYHLHYHWRSMRFRSGFLNFDETLLMRAYEP